MRVLAISSGGGHWIELLRVRPAFEDHDMHFATVQSSYQRDVRDEHFYTVRDATAWTPLGMGILAVQIAWLMLVVRPDVVVTTGAAPGYFAVRIGKWVRARTIWIDSLANVDEISKAGRLAGPYVDLWLTQWPELASPQGPEYSGQVL